MSTNIKVISTDFDGTIFTEFENPPVPEDLQTLIAKLQDQGAKWVINTGRDMSNLMEALGRAGLAVEPDYLVLVEREIYSHHESQYVPHTEWNRGCNSEHAQLFARIAGEIPEIVAWINARFHARIYEDPYSPFCLIAGNNGDMDQIVAYLNDYCKRMPELALVRNDVYARFSHKAYNKGTALAEICRGLGCSAENVFAVGDHLNDLPMLQRRYARLIAAPANAVPEVRRAVVEEGGYVCQAAQGLGVAEAINYYLERDAWPNIQRE